MKILTDNPYLSISLPLPTLCNLSAFLTASTDIAPQHSPELIGVEEVRSKDVPPTSPPEAIRYIIALPGSGYLRIPVKVDESTPSITAEDLAARRPVKVVIEGFTSGAFLTNDGGARPYFKAKKIVPATTPSGSK